MTWTQNHITGLYVITYHSLNMHYSFKHGEKKS